MNDTSKGSWLVLKIGRFSYRALRFQVTYWYVVCNVLCIHSFKTRTIICSYHPFKIVSRVVQVSEVLQAHRLVILVMSCHCFSWTIFFRDLFQIIWLGIYLWFFFVGCASGWVCRPANGTVFQSISSIVSWFKQCRPPYIERSLWK